MTPTADQSQVAADPHKIEQILSQIDELPVPSGAAALFTADAAGLAHSIAADARLIADLRAVLGLPAVDPRPARTVVEELIARHTVDALRQLAGVLKLIDGLCSSGTAAPGRLERAEFWRHALAVGCAASRIAEALSGSFAPVEALAAGLVHDIGKAALNAALPKSYARVLRRCDSMNTDIADVERSVLGVDHTAAGRRLAERWGLPKRLIDVIWLHHHLPESLPAGVAAGRHVQIVQLADTMARERRIGFSGTPTITRPSRLLTQQLGLPEEKRQVIEDGLLADMG